MDKKKDKITKLKRLWNKVYKKIKEIGQGRNNKVKEWFDKKMIHELSGYEIADMGEESEEEWEIRILELQWKVESERK